MLFAFRRHESPFQSSEVAVKGIDPETTYELTFYETYDPLKTVVMKGADMKKLMIEIGSKPGSLLIEYRKVK